MPVDANAAIEISTYKWVPGFARGMVRDLRVRWALEEAGLAYRVRLLDATRERPKEYLLQQPFGQIPVFNEGEVHLFESGAIVLHIAERCAALMPRDAAGRARTTAWAIAALNSIEPRMMELVTIDAFNPDAEWAKLRRPGVVTAVQARLAQLAAWLGERDHLEERFTAGDLMMTTILRTLRHTDIVAGYPNLARYQVRCEARPAFQRALAAHLAVWEGLPG